MEHQEQIQEIAQAANRLVEDLTGRPALPTPSLTVIGTGIQAVHQLTIDALAAMAEAEVLVHVIGDPVQEDVMSAINPEAESLTGYYVDGLDRTATYEAMVQHVLGPLTEGKKVVSAFYGHPGVFTYPSHESVRRARAMGYPARMLPAISSEDCLFADLGVDPGDGCQSFEATDFVFQDRWVDVGSHLILWQVGSIGNWTYESSSYDMSSFPALVQKLVRTYGPGHPVTIYEAPSHPGAAARVLRVPVANLHHTQVSPATTLHIPPAAAANEMVRRTG
jgi:uncharacterized protein YabN with tetrapyrrole methylase and pyrophosphatase domain